MPFFVAPVFGQTNFKNKVFDSTKYQNYLIGKRIVVKDEYNKRGLLEAFYDFKKGKKGDDGKYDVVAFFDIKDIDTAKKVVTTKKDAFAVLKNSIDTGDFLYIDSDGNGTLETVISIPKKGIDEKDLKEI